MFAQHGTTFYRNRHVSRIQQQILRLFLLLLVIGPIALGCGKGKYDARLNQRSQQLMSSSSNDETASDEDDASDKDDAADEDSSDPDDDNPFAQDDSDDEDEDEEDN